VVSAVGVGKAEPEVLRIIWSLSATLPGTHRNVTFNNLKKKTPCNTFVQRWNLKYTRDSRKSVDAKKRKQKTVLFQKTVFV
jgi:hypothetical protein